METTSLKNLKFEYKGRVQTIVFPAKLMSIQENVMLVGNRTHLKIEIGMEYFHFKGGEKLSNSLFLYQVYVNVYSV